jgi:Rod binding domain-containing protein
MQELMLLKAKNNENTPNIKNSDSGLTEAEKKALKKQTDQFESLLIKTLLDTAMKDSNELFGKDPGDKIYQSMYRDEISKISGGSFGLSQMLFEHLQNQNSHK